MQKTFSLTIFILFGFLVISETGVLEGPEAASNSEHALQNAFDNRISDLQILAVGKVQAILPDDNKGSRHQRFIIRLSSGMTVLIAHNIDLAPRVPKLAEGATIEVYGEYEWNAKGGVIHWTHLDPQGRHDAGWIQYQGQKYQ